MTKEPPPKIALALGYGGLLPLVALAAHVALTPAGQVPAYLLELLVYGAVILSFLGGVVWGRLLGPDGPAIDASGMHFFYSVVPALVGWSSAWVSVQNGPLVLVAGFVAAWLYDRRLVRNGILPAWYLRMRNVLTSVVVASLLTTAWLVR